MRRTPRIYSRVPQMSSLSSYSVPQGYEHAVLAFAQGNVVVFVSYKHVTSLVDRERGRARNPREEGFYDAFFFLNHRKARKELRGIHRVLRHGVRRGDRSFDANVPYGGPAEFRHYRSCLEFGSDIPCERANVRSCGYFRGERGEREFEGKEFQRKDFRVALRNLEIRAPSGEAVCALAVDSEGAVFRGNLLDLASEFLQGFFQSAVRHFLFGFFQRVGIDIGRFRSKVEGFRSLGKIHGEPVGFPIGFKIGDEFGGPVGRHDQKSARERIEGSGMSGLSGFQSPTHACRRGETGHSDGFVDEVEHRR